MRNGKRYARMQFVVILEVADIEWNSRTGGALYWRRLQVGRKWSLELTKDQEHVRSKISGANILLGSSLFFWVQCIPNGRPLPLRPPTMAHLSWRFGLRCRRDFSKTSVSCDCLRRRRSRVVLLHWPKKLLRWLNLFLHFPSGRKYPMCSGHWHLPGLSFHWHRLNDRENVHPVTQMNSNE